MQATVKISIALCLVSVFGPCTSRNRNKSRGIKNMFLYKFSKKLPWKGKILTVHVDSCKIIEAERRKLCFVNVLMGSLGV
jgi:hypothetical protein